MAYLMIFYLHYLGCDVGNINSVLESYDMGGTIDDVARYIQQYQLFRYNDFTTYEDGRQFTTGSFGSQCMTDFAQGRPYQIQVVGTSFSTLTPRTSVTAVTSEGLKIITIVRDGYLGFLPTG